VVWWAYSSQKLSLNLREGPRPPTAPHLARSMRQINCDCDRKGGKRKGGEGGLLPTGEGREGERGEEKRWEERERNGEKEGRRRGGVHNLRKTIPPPSSDGWLRAWNV